MPTEYRTIEAAIWEGLDYACHYDLVGASLEGIVKSPGVREVKGAFLTTHGTIVTRSAFTLELTGCGGGTVRLYVTRFRSGFGLWLMDARGAAKQV